jgi:hypothetical protein
MYRTAEDGRALLRAAQEIHAERHGAQTFTPGTHLPLEAAAEPCDVVLSYTLLRRSPNGPG